MARIVLSTFGTWGDLHPAMACALALRDAGYDVAIASSPHFQLKVEAEGLDFHAVRPRLEDLPREVVAKVLNPHHGTEYLFKEVVARHIEETFDDLLDACHDAELVIGHPVSVAVPLVAEKLGIPWLSTALQPSVFLSSMDPPLLPQVPGLSLARRMGPGAVRQLFSLARWIAARWGRPVERLREKAGLPPPLRHPIFDALSSPWGTLCLFSRAFAAPQADWPEPCYLLGFPWYDKDKSCDLSPETKLFLSQGASPIVFTLGTSAVESPDQFFVHAIEAARILRRRAILLVGTREANHVQIAPLLGPDVHVSCYEPHSQLFAHAEAVVHQAGMGTLGQALRAALPQVCVPFAHDQPDNAHRLVRWGVAEQVPASKLSTPALATALDKVLSSALYETNAIQMARLVREEDFSRPLVEIVRSIVGSSDRAKVIPIHRARRIAARRKLHSEAHF